MHLTKTQIQEKLKTLRLKKKETGDADMKAIYKRQAKMLKWALERMDDKTYGELKYDEKVEILVK